MNEVDDVSYELIRRLLLTVELDEEEIYELMDEAGVGIDKSELVAVLADYDLVVRKGRIDVE